MTKFGNAPPKLFSGGKVAGLRLGETPEEVRSYKPNLDKLGNIIRDKDGNPVPGEAVR